jgi:hypothetical protein
MVSSLTCPSNRDALTQKKQVNKAIRNPGVESASSVRKRRQENFMMRATPWEKLDRGTSYSGNGLPHILLKNARIAKEFPANAACKLTPAPTPKKFSKSHKPKKGWR